MNIVENFIASKTGAEQECEDGIFTSDDFVAVIDGATDKSGLRYDGMTGGRFATQVCLEALEELGCYAGAVEAAEHLTSALANRLPAELMPESRPSCAIALYSVARREIWQIGDVGFWYPDIAFQSTKTKAIDHFASGLRSAILTAELVRGTSYEELKRDDVGRKAVLSLLPRQALFCNNLQAGEWAYGALDGRTVPSELISKHSLPEKVTEIVLASDGYPAILPTLEASEQYLKKLLAEDPLCINALRGTKGLQPGNVSFDDRSYIRIGL